MINLLRKLKEATGEFLNALTSNGSIEILPDREDRYNYMRIALSRDDVARIANVLENASKEDSERYGAEDILTMNMFVAKADMFLGTGVGK